MQTALSVCRAPLGRDRPVSRPAHSRTGRRPIGLFAARVTPVHRLVVNRLAARPYHLVRAAGHRPNDRVDHSTGGSACFVAVSTDFENGPAAAVAPTRWSGHTGQARALAGTDISAQCRDDSLRLAAQHARKCGWTTAGALRLAWPFTITHPPAASPTGVPTLLVRTSQGHCR